MDLRGAVPVDVVVLAAQLRRSERQHVIKHADLSQSRHPVLAAEEVRRHRGARKSSPVNQDHAVPGSPQDGGKD
jgi:hypothetical protein